MTLHNHNSHKVTTLDLINRYLGLKIQKMTKGKMPVTDPNRSLADALPSSEINHIAILLDGRVQDVIRAQNRLAALLLSEPKFVEFNPEVDKVEIDYLYSEGKFINDIDGE